MTISDFDGARFWPAIKQFVIDKGVEPISLGEPEDETWPKIFEAMAVNGTPLSFGMGPGEIMRTLNAVLAQGGGYLLLAANVSDLSVTLPPLWAANSRVRMGSGLYNSSALVPIEQGKTLSADVVGGATIKLSVASAAQKVIEITGHNGVARGMVLDASLAAREAAGFASYTHGGFSLNKSNVLFEDLTVIDYGETVADSARLNTCAVVIDSDASNPSPTIGGVIRRAHAIDPAKKAPYGFRIRSEFIGYARGEIPGISGVIIEDSTVDGTNKNQIELAGPNVHGCTVRRVSIVHSAGQGGCETDYGAYDNLFEDVDASLPGADGTMIRAYAPFSFRASDQGDGKLKEGSGNRFRRCIVHDVVSSGSFGLACFNLISVRDSFIESCRTYNLRRGIGASNSAMTGILIETDYGEVHNILVTNPDFSCLDAGIRIAGANPCSDITVSGGTISAQRRGYSEPTSTPLTNVLFTGGLVMTADSPISCAPGRATPVAYVNGATLRGNQITLNSAPVAGQFQNTAFVLPPLGKAALETALPGITTANGNSYQRMPPGEAYLLRHEDITYDAKAAAYTACLDGLLSDGILDKLDVLSILAAPFSATALQNAVQAKFNAAITGALTFTAGQGFSGADATNYVELTYNPFNTGLFLQDSAFMAMWKGPGVNITCRSGSNNSRLAANTARSIDWRPNAAAAVTATAAADYAMSWWTRNNAVDFTYGYDGTTVGTGVASASVALTNANIRIGGTGGTTSFGNGLHKALAMGGYLTVAEKEQLRSRVNTLLAALV